MLVDDDGGGAACEEGVLPMMYGEWQEKECSD